MKGLESAVSLVECLLVCLVVILDEVFPEGFLSHSLSVLACGFHLFLVHLREVEDGVSDGVADLVEVVVGTVDGLHAVFNLARPTLQGICPESEPCEVGGDAWHVEGDGLGGGVAPRFVVGGEDGKVVADEEVTAPADMANAI